MTTSRRLFLGTALAGAGALLAGCSQDLPVVPASTASPEAHPALDADRLTAVLKRLSTGLAQADKAQDAAKLEGLLTGPAARVRGEEYTLAKAASDASHIHALSLTSQAGAVGLTTGFPRTALVVSEAGQDNAAPYLLTLTQDSARENFQLWSWVRLFAGVEIPETSTASVGSAQVDADSGSLVATPANVVENYVAALNDPNSDAGKAFADDALRQRLAAERAVDLSGMGNVSVTASVGNDGIKGLRTAAGGALVSTTLSFTTVYTRTTAGSSVKVGGNVGLLAGDSEVKGTVSATYDVMVAFSIPAKKAGGKPVALGTDLVLAKVDRDDSKAPA